MLTTDLAAMYYFQDRFCIGSLESMASKGAGMADGLEFLHSEGLSQRRNATWVSVKAGGHRAGRISYTPLLARKE